MAFNGGVQITAGDYSKYVNLIWADEIDSTTIVSHPVVLTRSTDIPVPAATILILEPNLIELDPSYEGVDSVFVMTDTPGVTLTKDRNTWNDKCIETNAPLFSSDLSFRFAVGWKQGAELPNESFATYITIKPGGGMAKYLHIVYIKKEIALPIFEYSSSVPTVQTKLPAVGAVVAINANTNQEWTISSDQSSLGPKVGQAGTLGLKTLALTIDDNPEYEERDIVVTITSALGGDPIILTFKQEPKSTMLSVTNIDPAPTPGYKIPAIGIDVNVMVLTNSEWWIESFGKRTDFPSNKLTGKITIPTNPETTQREIQINVGHGNTIDSTFIYNQLSGENLEYVSITPGGDIPVEGGSYTLTFEGDFAGGVLVEAYIDGMTSALAVSNMAYDKKPQIQIPANNENIRTRKINFRFKKEGSSVWENITDLVKEQYGAKVTPNEILPGGDIPTVGGTYSCSFSGVYSGKIYFRAMTGGVELDQESGDIGKVINLSIPKNEDTKKRFIEFSYSDDGTNWRKINDTRTQLVDAAIGGGNTTVNEFGDEEIINGKIEL